MHVERTHLYRHGENAVLRAAARPVDDVANGWPDLDDPSSSRAWLNAVWSRPELADPIRLASASLAHRLDTITGGKPLPDKQIRRATTATMRYVLRATSRHTPFGLFAGAASTAIGDTAAVTWGTTHRAVARVDTQWLADVINQLETYPDLLARCDVTITNLAEVRGDRLETPLGPNRIRVKITPVVTAVIELARRPIRFTDLVDALHDRFPTASHDTVTRALTTLVSQRVLISSLRAPTTATDPLGYLLDRLRDLGAVVIPAARTILTDLGAIRAALDCHNSSRADPDEQRRIRGRVNSWMRRHSAAGRTPLAVDLHLDAAVQIPRQVAHDVEVAASVLARLTRQPTGEPSWRDWYTAFCDRYGTGTLVPLADAINPESGLGYPAGYPGSVFPAPRPGGSQRDETLLALAWTALIDGSGEIDLDEHTIQALAVGDPHAPLRVPPHVEMGARISATSLRALNSGGYEITVAPARSFGTFTSRFATLITDSTGTSDKPDLQALYATVPTVVTNAMPVQLSFPPVSPHAENICRVPPYLRHTLPLGEHRPIDADTIDVDDLAITATFTGLHLVSLSRKQVIDPQVFHGLALEKQPPPLARFLSHLTRALGASWHVFDWGPTARLLPSLPRVRHGRAILAPARWRITTRDLNADTTSAVDDHAWLQQLSAWRERWRCPRIVELSNADRTLRLDLDEPAHAAILRTHLHRDGHAILTETATSAVNYGWIDGHAHEIVLPLTSTLPAEPALDVAALPTVTNRAHGEWPAGPETRWLNAKIYSHPERLDEILTDHLPRLVVGLAAEFGDARCITESELALEAGPDWWFIRYRTLHDRDHLRLRIRTPDVDAYTATLTVLGTWASRLRANGLAANLVIDAYRPEVGRYGGHTALYAAENVFIADSRSVLAQLGHLTGAEAHRDAMAAVNMIDTVTGFLGSPDQAMHWLTSRPAPAGPSQNRTHRDQALDLLSGSGPAAPLGAVIRTWHARAAALAAYRAALPATADLDRILESLLHMHVNRLIGVDRDREAICRRLARSTARTWTAQQDGAAR
jgi:thiopeptide-type bacteriocin biosynthesis protein